MLLALCKSGPPSDDLESAERLLDQLAPYLLEAHSQAIAHSPFLRKIETSPWEALTYHLVSALLGIGISYPQLGIKVYEYTTRYLHGCKQFVTDLSTPKPEKYEGSSEQDLHTVLGRASMSVSILGFLEAASIYFNFYNDTQQLEVVCLLKEILTERFLLSAEGAFSSIRNADSTARDVRDWKYFTKQYASLARPLSATLLQRGFMRLLVSCSSMKVAAIEDLQRTDIMEIHLSKSQPFRAPPSEEGAALVQLIADTAEDELHLLQDGADYLQLGSAWQQRLAFAVKQSSLISFLNCMIFDQEYADASDLMTWLDDTLADPVQMADHDLAATVLMSLAVVAKISPATASALSRSLPRFIVQSGITGPTVTVAARCLAHVLQVLSQDATITGLYSLGNVLSGSSTVERNTGSSISRENGSGSLKVSSNYAQQNSGSAISLNLKNRSSEDASAVYQNAVYAIVGIATICEDDKIIALAQSMLLQKLGRINLAVDLCIITGTAKLFEGASQADLKSPLKLYMRLCHEGVVQSNTTLLEAVCSPLSLLFQVKLQLILYRL